MESMEKEDVVETVETSESTKTIETSEDTKTIEPDKTMSTLKKILYSLLIVIGICFVDGLLAHLFSINLGHIAKLFTDNAVALYHADRYSKRVTIIPVYILIVGGFISFIPTFFLWNKKKWILIVCDIVLGLILLVLCILFTYYEDTYFYRVVGLFFKK